MADDRRLAVLRAIVQDYVATQEPVGSKALVERHRLGVSPATIRNDMAALEEEGLITQPHTSAGRIPTDAGYRLFVDRLSAIKPLSAPERSAITTFLDGAVDLDDVVQRSVRLLAQLTRQVAIVQYPILSGSEVRHVEVVPVGGERLLLVLILSTGRVEQRTILAGALDEEQVSEIRGAVLEAVRGRRIAEAGAALDLLPDRVRPELAGSATLVAAALSEAMSDHRSDERVAVGGAANLARNTDVFATSLMPLLEALEEHVVLMRLLGSVGAEVTVTIGHEGPVKELSGTSVVSTGYGPGGRESLAALGIVGPTRMDYPGTMAAVRAVARYVSTILDES